MLRVLPPEGIRTTFNGEEIARRDPVRTFSVKELPTEISDNEGILRRTKRATELTLFELEEGESPHLYEMGIPIVELGEGDPWHVDVAQKVPLTLDRSNVTPSYLRQLRLLVLNEMSQQLKEEDANAGWVREAAKAEECAEEAISKVLDLRFGEKRASYDPSDIEANAKAVSEGYTLIHGSQLSKEEWRNARRAGAILPAGQVTPSNSRLKEGTGGGDDTYPESKVTPAMRRVVAHAKRIGAELLGNEVRACLANRPKEKAQAWYCRKSSEITFNVPRLGKRWFERVSPASPKLNALLIHEFAHEFEGNHLSAQYYRACCRLGALLAQLAVEAPVLFDEEAYRELATAVKTATLPSSG